MTTHLNAHQSTHRHNKKTLQIQKHLKTQNSNKQTPKGFGNLMQVKNEWNRQKRRMCMEILKVNMFI